MTRAQWRFWGLVALGFGAWALMQDGDDAGLLEMPPDSQFDPAALREGIAVEMEHTSSPATAKKIAKAHLLERGDYYERLKWVEEG